MILSTPNPSLLQITHTIDFNPKYPIEIMNLAFIIAPRAERGNQ